MRLFKILKSIKNIFTPKDSWVVVEEFKSLGNWLYVTPEGLPDGLKGNQREIVIHRQIKNTLSNKIKFTTVIQWTNNAEYMADVDTKYKATLNRDIKLRKAMEVV